MILIPLCRTALRLNEYNIKNLDGQDYQRVKYDFSEEIRKLDEDTNKIEDRWEKILQMASSD